MEKVRFRPVFTPVGGAVLVLALVILIRSLFARNSYEIILASFMLVLLLVLGIIGMWKSKKLAQIEPGWKPPYPMTANAGEASVISGLGVSGADIPLFFRMHFIVRGRFSPCADGKGLWCRFETSVSREETSVRLPLDFPMSGIFQGEGICRLRDIFGFFSFACGQPLRRTIKVRSAPCFGTDYFVNAQSGAEDRRNKHSTDEERYYMREYTPGDRFRDINWKSSDKIDTLITRISPDNQEKVSRIEVYFRNFGPAQKPPLEALWLLDRAKARLYHFLRSLMEQHSSFVFDVRCAQGSWEIEDQESLDTFMEELAGLPFSAPQNEGSLPASAGELYVFSTACDIALAGFLLACNPRPVSLYLAQPGRGTGETETLYKSDFLAKGCLLNPRRFLKSEIKPLGAQANRVEIIYAETRL